jgi:hypothetical protein
MISKKPRFCGFVIGNDRDEYFSEYRNDGGVLAIMWARIPDLAKRFITLEKARKMIRKVGFSYPVSVFSLWETETQFIVSEGGKDEPPLPVPGPNLH